MKINEIIYKYLQEIDGSKDLCAHCHKAKKMADRPVCAKCAKEIDSVVRRKEKESKE